MLTLVQFDEYYLSKTYEWLNDPEIRSLIDGPKVVTRTIQQKWYNAVVNDPTYRIWGIDWDKTAIGACGIKHIDADTKTGEYWGYIGEKNYWGGKGHLIFEQIYERAYELNIETLTLNVLKSNVRAIKVYKNEGFNFISENDNMLMMNKRL